MKSIHGSEVAGKGFGVSVFQLLYQQLDVGFLAVGGGAGLHGVCSLVFGFCTSR